VSEAERDAKIEQLLLAGLDHYFAARYEQAINVWTRALFFDRSHPRARAYIERARSAQAERQRESEELVQNGLAAFNRGDIGGARRLLQIAIEEGAPADEALAVLGRLDRLEQGQGGDARRLSTPGSSGQPVAPPSHPRTWRPSFSLAVQMAVVALVAFFLAAAGRPQWFPVFDLGQGAPAAQTAPPFVESAPELPRRGEMALDRARTLVAAGRLRDALVVLDRVRPTDPERADADRLRGDVQKQLIALAGIRAVSADRDAITLRQP
jgi:tetratricopeptide (TPR) repeat protein